MSRFLQRFLANRSGATAIEYGMICALLSMVIVAAVGALGDKLYNIVGNVATTLNSGH
jgi:pilus assembly protein Flp/PilA